MTKNQRITVSISILLLILLALFIRNNSSLAKEDIQFELRGDKTITLEVGEQYIEHGFLASSSTTKMNDQVVIESNLNTNILGTYIIYYKLLDKMLTREVKVVDTTKPVIILIGSSEVYISLGEVYQEEGYYATDNYDQNIQDKVMQTQNLDYSKVGKYTIHYKVIDTSGNSAEVVRFVHVLENIKNISGASSKPTAPPLTPMPSDTPKPPITPTDTTSPEIILAKTTETIYIGEEYDLHYGVDVQDNIDSKEYLLTQLTITSSPTFNNQIPGFYTIYYNLKDSANNRAVEKTKVIHVVDITPPEITLNKTSDTIYAGQEYNLLSGVQITDDVDTKEALINRLTITSIPEFNPSIHGIYYIKYNVKDMANNRASEKLKVITVLDIVRNDLVADYQADDSPVLGKYLAEASNKDMYYWKDRSGNNNHMQLYKMTGTIDTDGNGYSASNQYYYFNGLAASGAYGQTNKNVPIYAAEGVTFEVYGTILGGNSANSGIMNVLQRSGNNPAYWLGINASTAQPYSIKIASGPVFTSNNMLTGRLLETSTKHHMMMTVYGGAGGSIVNAKLYLDGIEIDLGASKLKGVNITNQPLTIMASYLNQCTKGMIQTFRMYKRPLSEAEMKQNFEYVKFKFK